MVGGERSCVRSTKLSERSWSLSGQGDSDLSESVIGVFECEESVPDSNGGGGCGRSRGAGGVAVRGCGTWVEEGGGGRAEGLEGAAVGSVGSGKLGRSRCEGFRGWGAVVCRLDMEELGLPALTPHCCSGANGRSRGVESRQESLGRKRSLVLVSHDWPRL